MMNFEIVPVQKSPMDHVLKDGFLDRDLYQELLHTFPKCEANSGPTGFSVFWGDPRYEELLAESTAWRTFFELTQSPAFVGYCVEQFRQTYVDHGCKVDPADFRYVRYIETRADKERRHIQNLQHAINEIFVRPDILQGNIGYDRKIHLDHRRRLMTVLVYFCDAVENAMVGGDLVLLSAEVLHGFRQRRVVRPAHNRMAAFACSNESFHEVPRIVQQSRPRNFVQITLSSSYDLWPDQAALNPRP